MEEPYEGENTNPEVIEDLYVLKTKIDTSDIAKLRRELQQVRYELAQAQSDVRRLRNSPEGSFSQVGNINITSQLKMELDRVNELKRQQAQIVNQINSGSIRDTSVFTQALGSLNNELENIGKNSQALDAAVTIMEGAMARMAAVSKKSQDYKQLQESFKSFGIEANITGSGGRLDLSKVSEEAERINNTPVTIKFNDQELNTTVGQLEFVEAILARIATQMKQNIVLTKVLGNQISSSIITPSAGSSRLSQHSYIPPAFFVERAQAVNRDNAGFTQPARAVMAAFHGTPLLSLESRQQIRAATSPTQARGTALEDVKEVLTQAGLVKQSPARNQFMTMGTSSFVDITSIDKLTGVMDRIVAKIDSVILADIRYLGDRYGQRRQLTNRSQMGGIIDGILSDDTIANMEKAYHYQFAKQLALYNIDWKDTGGPQYYRRGTPSANISDKELAILDLVDQFPGSLKSSEITHALEMGHYQSLNSPVRDLQSKGLLRRAIVPPVPIPEAGIENQIHPAIMSLLATDPSLFLQFAMEASPIKFLDTSDRGRQVLEMMGTYNNPARVNTGMQLNAMVGNPEDTLVENYKSQMALPPANAWWLRGYNMLNYGDSTSGSKLLYYLEQMLNNQEAYNPEFIKNILPFIPYTKDPKSGYISVNPEGWVGKDSQYQLYPTNAGQYLGARSDLNWSLRTPYMFVDKIMEGIAHPNRDLFAKGMLGSEAYLKSVLNWASGPQGRGVNPQLERYTITPEQATQHFKILFGSLKLDANLLKTSDKFETQYGRQYVPYNQYEKSIIIRAANEMLKRSLPISSGIDVGSLELLRSRSFMSKGEGAQVDKMLYVARQEELSQLIRAVPDLQRYFRAFEAYQKSVLETYNANTSDLIGVFEEQADTLGTAKPVSPEMRRRIKNEQYAASSWKKYPEFWGTGYGQTYEDIYQGQNEPFGMSPDLSISSAALSRINAQSEKAALRTKMPAPYINKFRKDTSRSPLKGFTGILPWNAVLEHYSQYGSQDLNEDGIREFERLMSNPAELMKEIMWDYTYVEGENTRNPQIKNVIMDTYGTVMRKHAMFGWVSELKNPAAITALQQINDTYTDKLMPGNVDIALGEYLGGTDIQDEYDRFIINFTHNNWAKVMGDDKKGIKPTMGIFPLRLPLENIRDKIISNIEGQASDAIRDWTDEFGVETVNTRDITNVFKRRPDNTVSAFYEYIPEQVPVDDVIKRMVYDMQKGRMDPGLLEKYARAVASQKTRKDTGYSFKEGIESMWRNAGWDYEAMENLPQLVENQALFGFARTGTQGTFDFAGKQYQTGAGWDNQAIADSLGIDTSLIDDDMLHDMINTNMEFRGEVRSAAMNAMGVSSDKEWNQYIKYASHQVRQRLKRWQQISMSLQPGFDEFGENFTNTYTDDRVNFRTPYDFGDVQTEFGNIQDVSFLNWLKMEYFSRQPAKWPKGAITRGIENVQYDAMASSRDAQKRSWRKTDRERLQAWGVLQELPSVVSPVMSDEDIRQPAIQLVKHLDSNAVRDYLLPYINDGKVRMWRGAADHDNSLINMMAPGGLLDEHGNAKYDYNQFSPHGRWFSPVKEGAERYAKRKNGKLFYVDVDVSTPEKLEQFIGYNAGENKRWAYVLPGVLASQAKEYNSDIKQPFGAYTPDQDWFPMIADTSVIKYNHGFSMSESPASKMLGQMKDRFGISPMHQPNVVFTGSIPGDLAGSYILGKNKIEISKTAQDPASVMAHEYMHAVGNEKLVWKNNLQNMVDFYQGNNIPMFEHSKKVGEGLKNVKFDDIFKSSYLKGLKKSDPTAYARELERIAPFRKLFAGMSSDGVKNFFAMGEEIAIVMEKYHTDYEKHVSNMYGSAASHADKMKVAYVRNLVGIDTAFPTNIPLLPAAPDSYSTKVTQMGKYTETLGPIAGLLPPGVTEEPIIYDGDMSGPGWNARNVAYGPEAPGSMSRMQMADLRMRQFITARDADYRRKMQSLPDVSMMEPGKLVTGRGTELPMTYQLSSDKVGGVEGIYAEYARFKKWLGEQGIDTSKLKYDVITQYGADGSFTHQGSLFGPLRISDSVRKGRQMSDITKSIAENAREGYRSFNEQAARYEDTMDKMPLWTERFGSLGKSIAGASWQFTTLQMAALGIFFSMMSIVSVMGQGIGLVIGGIGDLDAMMKAKAMAGMSGNFKDESGNVFTGAYIDEALGITDQTRIDAWKNLTDLSSTISTMLSGFGSKVLTDPRFLESANDFVGRLFDVVTNPDNLEIVVNLSQTLFETIGNIVDKLPSLIKLFDMIASFHVPEGVPLIGGQSALSIYGQAALLSLIAMPIMAGVTLLTKMSGWMLESVGILGKINQWNVGRQIEQFALKEGYSKEAAALFRATGGMPKVSPDDISFYKRAGVDLSKLPSTGLPGGYATGLTEAEKAARITAGRNVAMDMAENGIKANGARIASAMEKAAVGIEAKAAGLMIFTAEDIMPKGWKDATTNTALANNQIPLEIGMLNVPLTDMTYDVRTLGKEWQYNISHPSVSNTMGVLPGVTGILSRLYQFYASFTRSYDAANLTGKTAADVNDQYQFEVVNPLTHERIPWTPDMEIPKEWQIDESGFTSPIVRAKQQEDMDNMRKAFADKFIGGGFAATSPIDEPSWMPTPTEQANKLSNEPLNSRWQKENSTSFKQENYINVSMTDERLDSMDAKLNAVLRMMGA